jgi:hypothetical protein
MWRSAVLERSSWVKRLAFTAAFGVGFGFAVVYFAKIRPRLEAVSLAHEIDAVDAAPAAPPIATSSEG